MRSPPDIPAASPAVPHLAGRQPQDQDSHREALGQKWQGALEAGQVSLPRGLAQTRIKSRP